jgi:non-ribosomal peptide synthase protein (TIGR01720 family)
LKNLPQPQISFNYLGQFDEAVDPAGVFQIAKESRGADRSGMGGRTHILEINGGRIGGRLQFEWVYSKNLHRESTIRSVAECFIGVLRQIIECETSTDEAVHYPPGDLVEFGWDEDDLEDISSEVETLVNSETFSIQRKKS